MAGAEELDGFRGDVVVLEEGLGGGDGGGLDVEGEDRAAWGGQGGEEERVVTVSCGGIEG